MSNRIYARNAYESPLAAGGAASTGNVIVTNPEGLVAPGYLVLDPEDNDVREYIRFTAVNGTTGELTCGPADRGLLGSSSGTSHPHDPAAPARAVAVSQWLDDIYDNIEVIEGWQTDHSPLNNPGDPHPEYLTQAEGDGLYTTPAYVDAGDAQAVTDAGIYSDSLDHDHATPIGLHADDDDAHHARYTDAEAVAAVGDPASGTYLPLAGGTLTGGLVISDNAADALRFLDPDNPTFSWWMGINDSDQFFIRSKSSPILGFTDTQLLAQVPLAMGSNKITGLATGTNDGDAVNKSQLDAVAGAVVGEAATQIHTDVTLPALTTTTSDLTTFTVAKPSGWGSYDVAIMANVQYAGANGTNTVLLGRVRIDGDDGTEVQTGQNGTDDDGVVNPVGKGTDHTSNVTVAIRGRYTGTGFDAGRYVTAIAVLTRKS